MPVKTTDSGQDDARGKIKQINETVGTKIITDQSTQPRTLNPFLMIFVLKKSPFENHRGEFRSLGISCLFSFCGYL